jgi:L-2-hydroxyglutarate oxidase
MLTFPGFWRMARRHWRMGLAEQWRSLSKRAFVAALRRLVPAVEERDLVRAGSGVRAQALLPSGGFVDDFLIVERPRALHVCNAPSPAATASLEIAGEVARRAEASFELFR